METQSKCPSRPLGREPWDLVRDNPIRKIPVLSAIFSRKMFGAMRHTEHLVWWYRQNMPGCSQINDRGWRLILGVGF